MTSKSQKAFRISEGVVFRELDGEAVLLNLDSGLYFGLDEVGTRMWQLLADSGRVDAVLEEIAGEYDASAEVLRRDLEQLIARLVEKGLLVQSSDDKAAS